MSIEERVLHMERDMVAMQRGLRRTRLVLVAVVLALVGLALVGATGDKDAVFDTVTARQIAVMDDRGLAVDIGSNADGGIININHTNHTELDQSTIMMYADQGNGVKISLQTSFRPRVFLGGSSSGGGFFNCL
jgi:hypothetical protein